MALAQQHHAQFCFRFLGKVVAAACVAVVAVVAAIVVGAGFRCQAPKSGKSAARHITYMLLPHQAHRPRVLALAGGNQIPQARWLQVFALTVQRGLTLPCGKRKPLRPGKVAVVAAVVAAVAVAVLLLLMLV